MGIEVKFCPVEDQDYDFVATWQLDETQHFCPVQLEEVVPLALNDKAHISNVISNLSRYVQSDDVQVAIHLNQVGRFDPTELELPANLRIGGLWVFGACSADQSIWGIWGDFMQSGRDTLGQIYRYPT